MTPERLETAGGYFGWLLRLVQERYARSAEFRDLLARVVQHLETMPSDEQQRWKGLLSYISGLVYHDRGTDEHTNLQATLESSVQAESHRQEVRTMGQTMAEYLEAKGRKVGRKEGRKEGKLEEAFRSRQQTLLRQLTRRFGEVPAETSALVQATQSVEQLDAWLDNFATAKTLADVGIH